MKRETPQNIEQIHNSSFFFSPKKWIYGSSLITRLNSFWSAQTTHENSNSSFMRFHSCVLYMDSLFFFLGLDRIRSSHNATIAHCFFNWWNLAANRIPRSLCRIGKKNDSLESHQYDSVGDKTIRSTIYPIIISSPFGLCLIGSGTAWTLKHVNGAQKNRACRCCRSHSSIACFTTHLCLLFRFIDCHKKIKDKNAVDCRCCRLIFSSFLSGNPFSVVISVFHFDRFFFLLVLLIDASQQSVISFALYDFYFRS